MSYRPPPVDRPLPKSRPLPPEAHPSRAAIAPPARYHLVGGPATLALVAISILPSGGVAKYRYSFLFLVPILWTVFAFRRRLLLRPLHFALFALALVLHDLGAFGGYQRSILGLEFDWCVHFTFGLVGGLILARLLHLRLGLSGPILGLFVVLLVTGIGGLHEIVEAASTKFLGPEYGMLWTGPGNAFDTQEDLMSNVVGASVAFALHGIGERIRRARAAADAGHRGLARST
jgi:uncharacterized membrane protein YjdF